MPHQHRHPPISIRLSGQLRDWLITYARNHERPVQAIVAEALEEYRAQHEQKGNVTMDTVTTAHARDYLQRAFTFHFMQPYETAQAPIAVPGVEYRRDGTLPADMKANATNHLLDILREHGYVIALDNGGDVAVALHHVLWDQWTKDEVGNGRFTGRLFDDYGRIYHGCTAHDAASYTVERLAALGGALRSYTSE
jgi:hypothetical protein